MDPGIRTGTKCAVIDENGKYLESFVIYQHNKEQGKKSISQNSLKSIRFNYWQSGMVQAHMKSRNLLQKLFLNFSLMFSIPLCLKTEHQFTPPPNWPEKNFQP